MTTTDNHRPPTTILVIDIGGSKVKILATGETAPRTCRSGKRLTPTQMVAAVHELADYLERYAAHHGLEAPRTAELARLAAARSSR